MIRLRNSSDARGMSHVKVTLREAARETRGRGAGEGGGGARQDGVFETVRDLAEYRQFVVLRAVSLKLNR